MFGSRRKFLLATVWAGTSACLPFGWQALGDSAKPLVSTDGDKVAIRGYDTVAYFTDGKPTKGSPDFESVWLGARWRFASAAHRDLFATRPEAYAPRFGGFCAGAIAMGVTVRPDPEAWIIVDGKLYLNGDKAGLVDFRRDTAGNIQKAEEGWKALSQ